MGPPNTPASAAQRPPGRSGRIGGFEISSTHKFESPTPAGLGGKMDNQIDYLRKSLGERGLGILVAWRLKRPVDEQWTAGDKLTRHETPKATIPTLLPIIAHDEIMTGRHY